MIRVRRDAACGILATALLVACQLIVPGELPEVKCASADPSACPSGMTCDVSVGRCVAALDNGDSGDEDVTDVDASDEQQPPDDAPVGPADLGESCVVAADCKSSICGTSAVLSTAIISSSDKPICTTPCCTSADCPSGFVCFGAGTGGNYCVPSAKAGRSPPGSGGGSGGTTCSGNTQCRSGLCSGGRCVDTCCMPTDCATGTVCRIDGPPTIPHYAWTCALPNAGGSDIGATCTLQSDCTNDNCVGFGSSKLCRPSCCSNANCSSQGFTTEVCAYGDTQGDKYKSCFSPGSGGGALGTSCGNDFDCESHYCDPELKRCGQPCCRDRDCPTGYACRPSADPPPYLRCVRVR